MVRFIICDIVLYKNELGDIYIPIWLDLLLIFILVNMDYYTYLHSNMVRFIIPA